MLVGTVLLCLALGPPNLGSARAMNKLELLELDSVEDKVGARGEATIDLTGFSARSTAEGVDFSVGLLHPVAELDCLGKESITTVYLQPVGKWKAAVVAVHLHLDGEIKYGVETSRRSGEYEVDETISAALVWDTDDSGAVAFSLPWDLVPLERDDEAAAWAAVFSIRLAKLTSDTWSELERRNGRLLELAPVEDPTAPETTESAPEPVLDIVDGALTVDGAVTEGVIGHLDGLCSRGPQRTVTDVAPNGKGKALLIRRP